MKAGAPLGEGTLHHLQVGAGLAVAGSASSRTKKSKRSKASWSSRQINTIEDHEAKVCCLCGSSSKDPSPVRVTCAALLSKCGPFIQWGNYTQKKNCSVAVPSANYCQLCIRTYFLLGMNLVYAKFSEYFEAASLANLKLVPFVASSV